MVSKTEFKTDLVSHYEIKILILMFFLLCCFYTNILFKISNFYNFIIKIPSSLLYLNLTYYKELVLLHVRVFKNVLWKLQV